ncbi:efflux RND transporter periplasmic adaptor subunit [Fulvivirga sp. M361]|uniref:efflux RND transporter periplasmic adaptor subunit n=1 Tax=Fulvivirga sp. M361 TaxID=2594266 RepID=UPI00117A43B0|nr:efflux RND transporter periplasmic adaptor subunit [Fulvivirga sp. M361]TRX54886.1 efflux RND transporter periplasmic adaptor subunit [Fulvivirga sp. M361]
MKTLKHAYLALLSLTFLYGCENSGESEKAALVKPIKCGVVESFGGLTTRTFNGITHSGSETKLSFRTGGLITRLNVVVGQRIKKGQLLAQLDQTDALLALQQAEADVKNAKVQLETASASFERAQQLYQTNNASLSDYEKAKSTLSSAQSSYEISVKRLDLQRSQVSYTTIAAPMSGIVSLVSVETNEVVRPGQPILTMSREGSRDIEAQAGVPEKYISKLKQGSPTNIRIPTLSGNFDGVITEVGYTSSGGTYPVITSINNPSNQVRPGMPVEVTFTFGDENQEKQLIVPVKAVGEDQNGQFVYLLNPLSDQVYEAKKKIVEIGSLTSGGFIVRSGLTEDQIVAIAGLRTLYDGMKVTLLTQ